MKGAIMKSFCLWLMGAGLLLSGVTTPLLGQVKELTKVPHSGETLEQLGSRQPDAKTGSEVRESLAGLVNEALTANKFPDLVAHLARPDRTRIGPMPRENYDNLNKAITQLRQDFQAKYHRELVFTPEMIEGADITLGTDKNTVTFSLQDLAVDKRGENAARATGSPSGVESGNTIPKKTGLSTVSGPTVAMINEAGNVTGGAAAWKADIPNEISGRQLKETLTRHLQKVDDQKAAWADDPKATYHAAASAVLQALTDATLAVDQ
jgi:hypothetical protein